MRDCTAYISTLLIEKLNRPSSQAGKGAALGRGESLTLKHMWLTKSHEHLNLNPCFLAAGCAQYLIYAFKLPLSLFK